MKLRSELLVLSLTLGLTACGITGDSSNSPVDTTEKPPISKPDVSSAGQSAIEAVEKPSPINNYQKITLPDTLARLPASARKKKAKQFYDLSQDYREKYDYEKMVESATIAILLDPGYAEAYLARGRALHHSAYGDDALALADVEKAARLNPRLNEVNQYLGRLYDSQKKYDLALKAYDRAIALNPRDRDARTMKAGDLRMLGRTVEAIDCYTGIIREFPTKSGAYVQRGSLYEYLGQNQRALNDYTKACQLNKDDMNMGAAQVYRVRAKLLIKMGKTEKAIQDLNQVLSRDSYDEESLRLRALEYEKLGELKRSLADLNRSIELAPEYNRASYEVRARIYRKLGKKDLAAEDLKRAGKIRKKPAEIPIYSIKRSKN